MLVASAITEPIAYLVTLAAYAEREKRCASGRCAQACIQVGNHRSGILAVAGIRSASCALQNAGSRIELDDDLVIAGDNLPVLERLPAGTFDLVYIDPPFNTGRAQTRRSVTATADAGASRVGFGGRRYRTSLLQSLSYDDTFGDYLGFLEPRLTRARELLAPARDAVLPHRLSRGPLLQAAARRGVRARRLPQRDHLGL